MTREEAWKRVKGYLYDVLSGEEADEIIKALEQEPVLDKIKAEIIELRSRQNVGVLECLDIIDKYEREGRDDEIKVGDEVRRIGSDPERDDCDFGICLMKNSKTIYVMRADGSTGEEDREGWYKTGRHFDQIKEVLKAMRSE